MVIGILIVLAVAFGINAYGIYRAPIPNTYVSTETSVSDVIIVEPTTETITRTTSVTATHVVTSVIQGIIPPISNVVLANISVGGYAWNIAVNSNTDTIYETGPFSNLFAIDGMTNKIKANISTGNQISNYIEVNPNTDLVYTANVVIDGATNKIIGRLPYNISAIGIDSSTNVVYAAGENPDGSSSIVAINGSNNQQIARILINGTAFGVAVNSRTHMVYLPICSNTAFCTPSYVIAINGTSRSIVSRILIGQNPRLNLPFAIAVNSITNMVYVATQQLISINASTNSIVARTSLSAYTIQCRGIAVNTQSNQIYITGWGLENFGSFFVVNGANYSLLNAFVGTGEPVGVAFNSNNSEIYIVQSQTDSILALRSSSYNLTQ